LAAIGRETAETASLPGTVSDAQRAEIMAREKKLMTEWRAELKGLVAQDPKSIWADDAQYVVAVLNAENPQEEIKELEELLARYPDFKIEDWTKKYVIIVPSNISPAMATVDLCVLYKKMGELDKLRSTCEKGMKNFPEDASLFKKILDSVR